jgi:hypothetical protein
MAAAVRKILDTTSYLCNPPPKKNCTLFHYWFNLIIVSSTCLERPSGNPQEDSQAKILTPNSISTKVNGNNRQCLKTIKSATHHRLTQEIEFLIIKKEKPKERLYKKCMYRSNFSGRDSSLSLYLKIVFFFAIVNVNSNSTTYLKSVVTNQQVSNRCSGNYCSTVGRSLQV